MAIPSYTTTGDVRKYTFRAGVFRDNDAPGFYAKDALVIVFKAPPTDSLFTIDVTHTGGIDGPSWTRTFVLSKKPCDFAIPQSADALWADEANVMSLRMSSGTPGSGRPNLEPGREYYINVMNTAYGRNGGVATTKTNVLVTPGNR